jgi:hypothetical protein
LQRYKYVAEHRLLTALTVIRTNPLGYGAVCGWVMDVLRHRSRSLLLIAFLAAYLADLATGQGCSPASPAHSLPVRRHPTGSPCSPLQRDLASIFLFLYTVIVHCCQEMRALLAGGLC